MGAKTDISWCDSTWNPIRGCSRVSPGCEHCYAETTAHRYNGVDKNGKPLAYHGLTTDGKWNGQIKFVAKHFLDPFKWKDSRKIFVNSMSDLFHENLEDNVIADIFMVMAMNERHTFQVLTKRAHRMYALLKEDIFWTTVARKCEAWADKEEKVSGGGMMGFDAWIEEVRKRKALTNVWLGVSAEDQKRLKIRMPYLLSTPAAVRWVSAEPLLGPLDFGPVAEIGSWPDHGLFLRNPAEWDDWKYWCTPGLDWLVIGGESGAGARPCELEWIRDLKNRMIEAKVPVFVKQLGKVVYYNGMSGCSPDGKSEHWPKTFIKHECKLASESYGWRVHLHDDHGGDMAEWPEDMRVQEFPAGAGPVIATHEMKEAPREEGEGT